MRKLAGNLKQSNTLLIFINQIRMKIGVMFGNPETTTGGNALKFYASVRLDIRRIGAVKEGDNVVGSETRVKVVKTKSPRRLSRPSSRSSTAKASTSMANWLTGREREADRESGRMVQLQRREDWPGKANATTG